MPNSAPGYHLEWEPVERYGELFTLQRAAFVDEAVAYATPDVPSLTETLTGFTSRTRSLDRLLVAADQFRIVGAVGARITEDVPWLERLMTAPDRRGEGIGQQLVTTVVDHYRSEGVTEMRAVVGDRNPLLLAFYTALGFNTVGRTEPTDVAPELLILGRDLS